MGDDAEKDEQIAALQADVDDCMAMIEDYENELKTLREQLGSKGGDTPAGDLEAGFQTLVEDNQTLTEERDRFRSELTSAKEDLESIQRDTEAAEADKRQLEEENRKLVTEVDETKRALMKEKRAAKDAKSKEDRAQSNQRANQNEAARALSENITLHEKMKELTTENEALESTKDELVQHLEELVSKVDDLTEQNLALRRESQMHEDNLAGETEAKNQLADELKIAKDFEQDYEQKFDELNKDFQKRFAEEQKARGNREQVIEQLKRDVEFHKSEKGTGVLQEEIGRLNRQSETDRKELDRCKSDLEQALLDLEQLSEALEAAEDRSEQAIYDKVAAVRREQAILAKKLQKAEASIQEEKARYQELTEQKDDIEKELLSAEHWKATYEAGHGLKDAVRYQKKLKADLRRRDQEMEKLSEKLGEAIDARDMLYETCQLLKQEAGLPMDFVYPEFKLKESMMGESARQSARIHELERQIQDLERERHKHLRMLVDNAAQIGEKGIKFVGLTVEQLMQVNDFARNIRDGKGPKLPMDDRSVQLTHRVKELESELDIAAKTIERLERAVAGLDMPGGGGGGGGAMSIARGGGLAPLGDGELSALQDSLRQMLSEQAQVNDATRRNLEQLTELPSALVGAVASSARASNSGAAPAAATVPTGTALPDDLRAKARDLLGEDVASHVNEATQRQMARLLEVNQLLATQLQQAQIAVGAVQAQAAQQPQNTGLPQVSAASVQAANAAQLAGQMQAMEAGVPQSALRVSFTPYVESGSAQRPLGGEGGAAMQTPTRRPGSATGGIQLGTGGSQFYGQTPSIPLPIALRTPTTPHGKAMLTRQLSALNLPPEEWADEVRELNAQLVECLEQLNDREDDLAEHEELLRRYETHLASIKQQMAVVYRDYIGLRQESETKEKDLRKVLESVREERDKLQQKVRRFKEIENIDGEGGDLEARQMKKLHELARRLVVHEVNEQVLARRYTSLNEQCKSEAEGRRRAELDLLEMEEFTKMRILYLEQWKAGATTRLSTLQKALDSSAPKSDLAVCHRELVALREDYLKLLEREAEVRVSATEARDLPRLVKKLRLDVEDLQVDLTEARTHAQTAKDELKQKDKMMQVAMGEARGNGNAADNVEELMGQVAQLSADLARREVEVAGSEKRVQQLRAQVADLQEDNKKHQDRVEVVEQRAVDAQEECRTAREEMVQIKNKYEGGIDRHDRGELEDRLKFYEQQHEGIVREGEKHKEIADLASTQVEHLSHLKRERVEAIEELRRHCSNLESRSDDDAIIGKLQHQLMATKSSYRAFARKHEITRGHLRRSEAAARELERRLDAREEALHRVRDEARKEILAAQDALQQLQRRTVGIDGGGMGVALTATADATGIEGDSTEGYASDRGGSVLAQMKVLSEKVNSLSELGKKQEEELKLEVSIRRRLEGEVSDTALERDTAKQLVDDLKLAAIDSDKQENSLKKDKLRKSSRNSHAAVVARRLVSLSEELRANKLAALQARRQVQTLREDKRHLEATVQQLQDNIVQSEEQCADLQTKDLLRRQRSAGHGDSDSDDGDDDDNDAGDQDPLDSSVDEDELGGFRVGVDKKAMKFLNPTAPGSSATTTKKRKKNSKMATPQSEASKYLVATEADGQTDPHSEMLRSELGDLGGLNVDEALAKVELKDKMVVHLKKEVAKVRREMDSLRARADSAENEVRERDYRIRFYQDQAKQEGLAMHPDSSSTNTSTSGGGGGGGGMSGEMRREQERLQQVANTTIQSLKSLLEDKNRMLEKYKHRLEDVRAQARADSQMDKREIERLTEKLFRENQGAIGQLRTAVKQIERAPAGGGGGGADGVMMNANLLQQIDDDAKMIGEREETIHALELKLRTANNQRKLAEERCGESLDEMEKMKADMVTLATQLQDAEERVLVAMEERSGSKKITELKSQLAAKSEKMKGLRQALVRLKGEFLRAEETHENQRAEEENRRETQADGPNQDVKDQVVGLKDTVSSLREAMQRAKDDLEKAKRKEAKTSRGVKMLREENERLSREAAEMESEVARLEVRLKTTLQELEKSRHTADKLKERIRSIDKSAAPSSTGGGTSSGAERRVDELERRIAVLQAQNSALRSASESGTSSVAARPRRDNADDSAEEKIGTAGSGGGAKDSSSQIKALREENTRLRRRAETLTKRIQERSQELETAEGRSTQARGLLDRAMRDKEGLQRRLQQAEKQYASRADTAAAELDGLSETRARVFELEEENAQLKRQVHLEFPQQLESLGLELRQAKQLAKDADASTRAAEAASQFGSGPDGRLRASEERFNRDSSLQDELESVRKARRDMEARTLERDASAMELRFDLEAKAGEVQRLQRRVRELEARQTASQVGSGGNNGGGGKRPAGGRFRRERDLEGVVDALKRVVKKQEGELERAKRGATSATEAADAKRQARESRARVGELEKELEAIRRRASAGDEAVQRLAQKQDLAGQLRRQLRSRDSELKAARQRSDELERERGLLQEELHEANLRVEEVAQTVHALRKERGATSAAAVGAASDSRGAGASAAAEVRTLQNELEERNGVIDELRRRLRSARSSDSGRGEGSGSSAALQAEVMDLRAQLSRARRDAEEAQAKALRRSSGLRDRELQDQNKRLRDENAKLAQELQAFDLNFFEEIEDLKWKYKQAVQKLGDYERGER